MAGSRVTGSTIALCLLAFITTAFQGCEIVETDAVPSGIIHVSAFDTTLNRELDGAAIFIDGVIRQEKTPASIAGIEAGEHNLKLRPSSLDYPLIDTLFTFTPPLKPWQSD